MINRPINGLDHPQQIAVDSSWLVPCILNAIQDIHNHYRARYQARGPCLVLGVGFCSNRHLLKLCTIHLSPAVVKSQVCVRKPKIPGIVLKFFGPVMAAAHDAQGLERSKLAVSSGTLNQILVTCGIIKT